MKKLYVLILATLLIVGTAWAKSTRVKFPPGRTTVVLNGRTTGGPSESGGMDPVGYILRASKGQTMTLHLTSAKKNAVFGLYAPGMDLVEGRRIRPIGVASYQRLVTTRLLSFRKTRRRIPRLRWR